MFILQPPHSSGSSKTSYWDSNKAYTEIPPKKSSFTEYLEIASVQFDV